MIEIKVSADVIAIDGHAGYEESGKDIICSAVTVLAFLESPAQNATIVQMRRKINGTGKFGT